MVMSYTFKFKKPFYQLDDEGAESWFVNSYKIVDPDDGEHQELEEADKKYERRFKVKLIVENIDPALPHIYYVTGVEFPSEAEATLFVLKWA